MSRIALLQGDLGALHAHQGIARAGLEPSAQLRLGLVAAARPLQCLGQPDQRFQVIRGIGPQLPKRGNGGIEVAAVHV